ncbi:hypothetical protein DV959_13935, partial [Staphylococcus pseudintermedius]
MRDAELDQWIAIRPVQNHVRYDGAEPMLQGSAVEPVGPARVADQPGIIRLQRRQSEHEPRGCYELAASSAAFLSMRQTKATMCRSCPLFTSYGADEA